jgi:CshA-type fibril repeat protein
MSPSRPLARWSRPLAALTLTGASVLTVTAVTTSAAHAAPTPLSNPVLTPVAGTPSSVATTVGAICRPTGTHPGVGTCGSPVTMQYGVGTQYRLTQYDVGSRTYQTLPSAAGETSVELLRVDNPQVQGERNIVFAVRTSQATPINQVVSSNPGNRTEGEVLGSDLITEGSDNTFANNAKTVNKNNIERITFLRKTPMTTAQPGLSGLTILERGGNDAFRLAAVTAVDAAGKPTAWGPRLDVPVAAWGGATAGTILNAASTVLSRDPSDAAYRPTDATPTQKIAGMFVSFADLGVAPNQPVYGVSMIPTDQDSPAGPFTHLDTTEAQGGGIDLVGGVFVSAVPPTAQPLAKTDVQGKPQTYTLVYAPGDPLNPIVPAKTVLVAPPGGTLSNNGTVVTVPGQGTYTLTPGTSTVVFQPLPEYVGVATPISYTVTDKQGLTATSTISPTVTPIAVPDTTTGPFNTPQNSPVLVNDTATGVALVPSTLTLIQNGTPVPSLTVPNQGTYTVTNGTITFTPVNGFIGTATPATYRVTSTDGFPVSSTYTPTVLPPVPPMAVPDTTTGPQGQPQTSPVLTNDGGPRDDSSLTLISGGNPVTSVTVPGQGTYTVTPDHTITFTPLPAFIGTATPVTYRFNGLNGTTASSTYTPTVTPADEGVDDETGELPFTDDEGPTGNGGTGNSNNSGDLAFTGSQTGDQLLWAWAFLGLGGATLLIARRRRA